MFDKAREAGKRESVYLDFFYSYWAMIGKILSIDFVEDAIVGF